MRSGTVHSVCLTSLMRLRMPVRLEEAGVVCRIAWRFSFWKGMTRRVLSLYSTPLLAPVAVVLVLVVAGRDSCSERRRGAMVKVPHVKPPRTSCYDHVRIILSCT